MSKEDMIELQGVVIEMLPESRFRVRLDNNGNPGLWLGQNEMHRIRVLVGDRVTVEMSPYDLTKGRINFRHPTAPVGGRHRSTSSAAKQPACLAATQPTCGSRSLLPLHCRHQPGTPAETALSLPESWPALRWHRRGPRCRFFHENTQSRADRQVPLTKSAFSVF
jgi:translation initiation factor IF-1